MAPEDLLNSPKELDPEQITAIVLAIRLGKALQEQLPQVAADFRAGTFRRHIAAKYRLCQRFGVSDSVAISAISYAVGGHDGGFHVAPYAGLITDQAELARLCLEHQTASGRESGLKTYARGVGVHGIPSETKRERGRKAYEQGSGIHRLTSEEKRALGRKNYEQKKGIHALSSEEKRKYGAKGGAVSGRQAYAQKSGIHKLSTEEKRAYGRTGGRQAYEQGLGFHAQTPEERRAVASKAGYNSLIARGFTPWKQGVMTETSCLPSEAEFAYNLSQIPGYTHQLIAEKLNEVYHAGKAVRNRKAVGYGLSRFRKNLGQK